MDSHKAPAVQVAVNQTLDGSTEVLYFCHGCGKTWGELHKQGDYLPAAAIIALMCEAEFATKH